jgi:hypothetical protein
MSRWLRAELLARGDVIIGRDAVRVVVKSVLRRPPHSVFVTFEEPYTFRTFPSKSQLEVEGEDELSANPA